jgi:hypothetical protein
MLNKHFTECPWENSRQGEFYYISAHDRQKIRVETSILTVLWRRMPPVASNLGLELFPYISYMHTRANPLV